MENEVFGEAKDGKRFAAESPEVKAYMEQYPDATLEVALGSVVMEHDKSLSSEEPAPSEEAQPEGQLPADAEPATEGDAVEEASEEPAPEAEAPQA